MVFLALVFITLGFTLLIHEEVDTFLEKKIKHPHLRRGLKWFCLCFSIIIFFAIFFYICWKH